MLNPRHHRLVFYQQRHRPAAVRTLPRSITIRFEAGPAGLPVPSMCVSLDFREFMVICGMLPRAIEE
jgi:hypothetical protein